MICIVTAADGCCSLQRADIIESLNDKGDDGPASPGLATVPLYYHQQCQVLTTESETLPVKCCKMFSQSCENVLMVIGGQNFNASSREHDMVYQVELLGQDKTCEVHIVFVFYNNEELLDIRLPPCPPPCTG